MRFCKPSLLSFRSFIITSLFWGSCCLVCCLSLLWFWPLRGLTGEYYDNPEWRRPPVFVQRDRHITLQAVTNRRETFPPASFSVTWFGWIRIDRAGEYTFATLSDDGSSLFINDELVVNNGGYHAYRKGSGKIILPRGLHAIRINYLQGEDAYELTVLWKAPGKPETALPAQVLYTHPFPMRGIGFMTRYLSILYPGVWTILLGLLVYGCVRAHPGELRLFARQYALNGLLALFSIIFMGLCLEGGLRVWGLIREHKRDALTLLRESQNTQLHGEAPSFSLKGIIQPASLAGIVYELKPNLQVTFVKVPLRTNSKGLRDVEYALQKPPQTFRIVGLGDSSVFGWGVKAEETSLTLLEDRLNADGSTRRYQVLNFAVPGYNTAIETEVFEKKCAAYAPDLVILHFNTNDYDAPAFLKPPDNYATLRTSYLFDLLYTRYHQLFRGGPEAEMIPFVFNEASTLEQSERLDEDPDFPEEYRWMVGKRGFLKAMEKLVALTQARGIPLVVYVVKSYPGLDPDYTPTVFRSEQLRVITELSAQHGFFLLNMYPAYMAYRRAHPDATAKVFWVSSQDSHPSAIAHQVEADALYQFLQAQNLLPFVQ